MAEKSDYFDCFGGQPFEIVAPVTQTQPFVFNSPHSGRFYPPGFISQSRLDEFKIRASEDFYVDKLFESVPANGVPLLKANFPRSWLDVNREPYELDPKMFEGQMPSYANISSVRVTGGLGTIPKIVAENQNIYRHRIAIQDGLDRIEFIYRPYHETLRRLIARTHTKFGYAVLVDCHSMPSTVNSSNMRGRPDFIIGDRYGASASNCLTKIAQLLLNNMGYHVTGNKPYAGGFITEHYGRPLKNLHALQIEINRGLYMNEQTLEPSSEFERVQADLALFSRQFMHYVERELSQMQTAAQ